jgi:hypothetical protein
MRQCLEVLLPDSWQINQAHAQVLGEPLFVMSAAAKDSDVVAALDHALA